MLDERRLAGAVGADEAVDLARGGVEGDAHRARSYRRCIDRTLTSTTVCPIAYFSTSAGSALSPGFMATLRSRTIRRMSSALKFNWCASASKASMRCSMMRRRSPERQLRGTPFRNERSRAAALVHDSRDLQFVVGLHDCVWRHLQLQRQRPDGRELFAGLEQP